MPTLNNFTFFLFGNYLVTIDDGEQIKTFTDNDELAIYFFNHKEWYVSTFDLDNVECSVEFGIIKGAED